MSSFLTPRWYSPFSVSSMKFISSWCTLLKTMVLFWIRLSLMSGVIRGEQSAMNTCCSVPGSCPGTVAKCPFTCITYEREKNIEHEIIYSHDLFLHNICSFSNNAALQPSNLIRSTCYDLRLLMFRRPISNLITQLECRYIFFKCYSLLSSVQQVRVCKCGVY